MRLQILFVMVLTLASTRLARADGVDPLTQEDHECVAALREAGSQHVTNLELANAAFSRAQWGEAARLYALLPSDSEEMSRLPLRRRCQALAELGQREEALSVCRELLRLVIPNAADLQANVAALMLGSGRPSDEDLQASRQMARRADGIDPDSVWSLGARCAIAQRVDDRSALADCSARLKALAPDHWLTQRFAPASGGAARLGKLALFGLLLLGLLLTLGHRLYSRRRTLTAAVVASAFAVLWSGPASAQAFGIVTEPATEPNSSGSTTPEEQEANPEALAFAEEAKLLQELTDKITAAESFIIEKQDWAAAVSAYVEIVTQAPHCGKCWRRLCEGFSYVADPVQGAHACRQTIASPDNNAWDRAMLVHHLLSGKSEAQPDVRAEAKRSAEEAVSMAPGERWGYDARCEIALRENNLANLKACAKKLDELAHDDRKTLSLLFASALAEQRLSDAEALIARGEKEGLDAASVRVMRDKLLSKSPLSARLRRALPSALLAMLLTAGLIAGIRFLLAARSRKAALSLPKNPA